MLTAYVQNLVARLASEDTREATLRVLIESAMTEARSSKAPERLLGRRLLKEGLALERIYIGASMIIQEYPSVETISLRVLAGFGYVEDGYSLRDLRHDLERMRNVQRNCVVWANLPASFHGRLGFNRQELATGGQAYGRMRPLHELCEESLDKEMVRIQATLSRNEHPWTGLQREGLSGAAGHVPEARSLKPGA